jgi:predicted DNA-binding transcriptional regulator AlpA
MSLIRKQTRITAEQVAEIWGCEPKTVYNGGAGTHVLTRVKLGRAVRWILEDVIAKAEKQLDRSMRF